MWFPFFTSGNPDEVRLLPGENGTTIRTDPLSQPHLADVDLDGDLDFFGGLPEGSILHWENTGSKTEPIFTFRTLQFGGILVLQDTVIVRPDRMGKPANPQHGASAVYLFDYENDGLTDVFFGDFLSSGIYRFKNTGSLTQPVFSYQSDAFPVWDPIETPGYNQVQFAGPDSLPDLFVGVNISTASRDNFLHYRNYGTRTEPDYFLETKNYLDSPDWGRHSRISLADINLDGLPDLIVGSQSGQINLLTAKTGDRYDLSAGPLVTGTGLFETSPVVADLNGDGLPDLISGTLNQGLVAWENTGSAGQPLFLNQRSWLTGLGTGNVAHPSFTDWDSDGDADLVVGNASGDIHFYENQGSSTQPSFIRLINWSFSIGEGPVSPHFADWDRNGFPDLLVGTSSGELKIYFGASGKSPVYQPIPDLEYNTGVRRLAPGGLVLQENRSLLVAGTERGGLMVLQAFPPEPPQDLSSARVYPNPGTSHFTVQTARSMDEISIYNLLGQRTDRFQASGTTFSFRFDHRAAGLYFARIRMGDQVISCRFLVIR